LARGGPRLVLFGPDTKHGARKKAGFKDYRWYIVHKRTELATGHRLAERREAELALADAIVRAWQLSQRSFARHLFLPLAATTSLTSVPLQLSARPAVLKTASPPRYALQARAV